MIVLTLFLLEVIHLPFDITVKTYTSKSTDEKKNIFVVPHVNTSTIHRYLEMSVAMPSLDL